MGGMWISSQVWSMGLSASSTCSSVARPAAAVWGGGRSPLGGKENAGLPSAAFPGREHVALLVHHVDQVEHVAPAEQLAPGRGKGRRARFPAPPAALTLRDDPADRLQDLLLRQVFAGLPVGHGPVPPGA